MTWKNLCIFKDGISKVLYERWIACYMMYDWNQCHAAQAFDNNEIGRYQQVANLLGNELCISPEVHKALTDLYNKVLAKDVEEFIEQHMDVGQCSRSDVELVIAKAIAEVFEENKGD